MTKDCFIQRDEAIKPPRFILVLNYHNSNIYKTIFLKYYESAEDAKEFNKSIVGVFRIKYKKK